MKPITFLELDRDNIISSLTDKNNNFSHEEAIAMYNKCVRIIALLDNCKNDKNKTAELLEHNLPQDIEKTYIINFIIRAIQNDDTYAYAYNYLAQGFNRDGFDVFYPIKNISTSELFALLEMDKPDFTIKMFALYVHYLFRAKYINGSYIDMINSQKEIKKVNFSTNSIANYIRYIDNKSSNKFCKTKNNLERVIPLLENYPQAKALAERDLLTTTP